MSMPMTEMRQPDTSRAPARDEERWQAVYRRDPAFDGKFFFAVRTTGVYCRPSCASRPAKRENVSFYSTAEAAERAGYRACKRCRPDKLGAPDPQGRGGQAGVRTDRGGRGGALARRPCGERGLEPVPFPSRVQENHRRDAEGLCRADAGAPRGRQAAHGGDGHRSDLRRRVQLFEPLLRERGGAARHDAERGPARRGKARRSASRSARRRSARCWSPRPTRACARSCSATIPTSWCATFRTASRAPSSWAATRRSSAWSRKWSGWSRRPVSGLDLPLDIRGTAFQERVWAGAPRHPAGQDGDLRRDRPGGRPAEGSARGRAGLRRQSAGDRDPLPSGGADGRRSFRLSLGRRAQARAHRPRGGVMKALTPTLSREARRETGVCRRPMPGRGGAPFSRSREKVARRAG